MLEERKISFKDIELRRSYDSDYNDIVNDFYIPALSNSIEYKRLAGFFSSSSIAIAARGIYGLLRNGGSIKLIICPRLSKNDLNIIKEAKSIPEYFIADILCKELDEFKDECEKNHVQVLGWMVANNRMEIKVAIVYDSDGNIMDFQQCEKEGIFHQKVGILKDNYGNEISFSGSINESAKGWLGNIEEFKVFRKWIEVEKEYFDSDIEKFDRFWNDKARRVKIFDVPNSLKERLIKIAPSDPHKNDLNQWYKKKNKITLFEYQNFALEKWISNNYYGIFEMATGTGKTFTALGCLNEVVNKKNVSMVVIACPYQHLIQQWNKEIIKFGIEVDQIIIADSSNPKWKNILSDALIDLDLGYNSKIIVLTTHTSLSSHDFIRIIQKEKGNQKIFLITDEVHGIGAEKTQRGLIEEYDFRLGLSATPTRWFDDSGTEKLLHYFKGIVYEFPLKDAINKINEATGKTYLTPFRYIPKFVSLDGSELEEYIKISTIIGYKYNSIKGKEEKDLVLENLIFKRANIIKSASNKFVMLEEILSEIGDVPKWTIVYCSPKQIDKVTLSLSGKGLAVHRFTMDEDTKPNSRYGGLSEREYILEQFAKGKYQFLIAMKCLDEGVDVPPARKAILMSSSGNPREYIQRIGRIIRRYEGKNEAILYDIIVIPSFKELPPQIRKIEQRIFKKEMIRYIEISKLALNSAEALNLLSKIIDMQWS